MGLACSHLSTPQTWSHYKGLCLPQSTSICHYILLILLPIISFSVCSFLPHCYRSSQFFRVSSITLQNGHSPFSPSQFCHLSPVDKVIFLTCQFDCITCFRWVPVAFRIWFRCYGLTHQILCVLVSEHLFRSIFCIVGTCILCSKPNAPEAFIHKDHFLICLFPTSLFCLAQLTLTHSSNFCPIITFILMVFTTTVAQFDALYLTPLASWHSTKILVGAQ